MTVVLRIGAVIVHREEGKRDIHIVETLRTTGFKQLKLTHYLLKPLQWA
jgi:hypothetical protein